MRFALVAGATRTARIDGISAAGADPGLRVHTPSADAEIVAYGAPVRAPVVPVSPSGCPTPAVVTRAVRELVDFDLTVVDAGLARPTAAPTVDLGADPGDDVRESEPVADADAVFEAARDLGAGIPEQRVVIGETIPGGTTTALGVLSALGERSTVSSSLPQNPLALKRAVVEEALAGSALDPGDAAGDPLVAVRSVGDPVLAAAAGLAVGALESGTAVTLAGGTQLAAAAALVRHAGVTDPLSLSTTSFVARDETADIRSLAADLDLELSVTDPGFDRHEHPAMDAFCRGEAKEGVGMGGALARAESAGHDMAEVRERILRVYDRLLDRAEVRP